MTCPINHPVALGGPPTPGHVLYQRARFSAFLPMELLYLPSHFWVKIYDSNVCRVGITPFAMRILGELVEHDFEVAAGQAVRLGQIIGWIEGFKAASDLYCVVEGVFKGGNAALARNLRLMDTAPFADGWLYEVAGKPDPAAVDVRGYMSMLDSTIDRMQGRTI